MHLLFQPPLILWRWFYRLGGDTQTLKGAFILALCLTFQVQFTISYNFKLGLLQPWNSTDYDSYPFLGTRSLGAAVLAGERITTSDLLGANDSVDFVVADTACRSIKAGGHAVELQMDETVDAFIGPPCSSPCETVADLTSYWEVPMTSWFCAAVIDGESEDPFDVHPTLARTYPTIFHIAHIIPTTLDLFDWNIYSVIHPLDGLMADLAHKARILMDKRKHPPALMESYQKPLNLSMAQDILTNVKKVSRIIFLLVGGKSMLDGDQQTFLLAARQLEITGDDGFVFIILEPFPDPGFELPWEPLLSPYANETVENEVTPEQALKEAYRAVLMVTMSLPDDGRLDDLMNDVTDVMMQPPHSVEAPKPSIMSAYLYDAVYLYAHAVNITMATQEPPLDGELLGRLMQGNISFEGMTGTVIIDEFGSRISDFDILDLRNNTRFEVVGNMTVVGMSFTATRHSDIDWPGMTQPLDAPDCGFDGEQCFARGIIAAIVVAVIVTVAIIILVPVARLKYHKFVKGSDWLIDRSDITFIPMRESGGAFPSNYRLQNLSNALSKHSLMSTVSVKGNGINKKGKNFAFATYNSHTVVLRKVQVHDFNLNKAIKRELKEMRWLVHDNINRFLGLCFPSTSGDMFYHVSEFSPKGSLKSILANDDVNLDLSFKASFIRDLARGMQFLHASEIKSHGILSSSTCYVDSRWVLKISGFGLLSFNLMKEDVMKQKDPEVKFSKMLWTAPELLRGEMLPSKGSQKGDVYSFGIILQEIVTRSHPFYLSGYTSREIIRRVIRRDEPPCRPKINEDEFETSDMATIFTAIYDLMKICWEELPEDRPDFTAIRAKLRGIQKGRKELDILDNMLSKMEKYTENLEKVVADRTGQLLEEKKKTDALLFRMLPEVVAEELKKGNQFPGEFFDHVTIYFSDVVGFTDLSAQSTPMQVVDLLNDLYTCFDAVLERFDVYKVETIGDAYMVVSGLPRRNGNRHAGEIACVALELLTGARQFRIRHKPDHQLQIRIGINTGPVAAGVVGLTMPRFCLFGDTVNTASRMESNSLPQKIHISSDTAAVLKELGGYVMEKRGLINIKGKGQMTTYWLLGTDSQIRPRVSIDAAISKKISTDTMISQDSLLSPSHRMSDAYDIPEDRLIEEHVNESGDAARPSTIAEKGEWTSANPSVPENTDDQLLNETDSRPISTGSWTDGGQESMRFSRSITPVKGLRAPSRLPDNNQANVPDERTAGGVRSPHVTDDRSSPIKDSGKESGDEGGYDNPVMDPRGTVIEEGESQQPLSPAPPPSKSVSPSSEGDKKRRNLRSGARTENNNYLSPAKRKTAITLKGGSDMKAGVSKA